MKERLDVLLVKEIWRSQGKRQKRSLCPEMFLWRDKEKIKREARSRKKSVSKFGGIHFRM